MPKKPEEIEPIDANLDAVVEQLVNPRTGKTKKNIALIPYQEENPRTPDQGELDLQIQKHIEIDGTNHLRTDANNE